MHTEDVSRIACLVISPGSGLTGTDDAVIARVKNRIWSHGHSLFHVSDPASANSLLLEYGEKIGAIFVIATRSCYATWLFVGTSRARHLAQFVIARFQLDPGSSSLLIAPSQLVELPAETPGISPSLDRELNNFLDRLMPETLAPVRPQLAKAPPVRQPAPPSLSSVTLRCSDQEICTLQEIASADEQGISLLKLGVRLNQHGIVRTMSLSVNGLRRKGLIQFTPSPVPASTSGYVERNLRVSDTGRQYLEQLCAS